mmetsp:Transcript_6053/g.20149  ORF Transcript_6053/g.20149 Transcript_6053/m.20149 type:complete len:224 (+) Transcript_6053:696-1367(+)
MVCTSYHRTSLSLFEHTSASAPLGEVKKSTAFVMPLSSWVTRVLCETPVRTSSTTSSPANPPAAIKPSRTQVVLICTRGKLVEREKEAADAEGAFPFRSEVSSEVLRSPIRPDPETPPSMSSSKSPVLSYCVLFSSPPPPPSKSSVVVARRVCEFQCTILFSLITYASFFDVLHTRFRSWKCTKLDRTSRVLCAKTKNSSSGDTSATGVHSRSSVAGSKSKLT